jgi:hypothetical protein
MIVITFKLSKFQFGYTNWHKCQSVAILSHHGATLGIHVDVDEKTLIINNDSVVHQVKFLFIVEFDVPHYSMACVFQPRFCQ